MKHFFILVILWVVAIVVAILTKKDAMIVFSVMALSVIIGKILENDQRN